MVARELSPGRCFIAIKSRIYCFNCQPKGKMISKNVGIDRSCSVVLFFVLFAVASFFLHLLLFYYAVHVVVNGQILEFGGVFTLVEDQLELVLLRVGAAMLLARWYRRWREQWINSNPMINKINSKC